MRAVEQIQWYTRRPITNARLPGRNSGRVKHRKATRHMARLIPAYNFSIIKVVLFISRNGNLFGDHIPWIAKGASRAI